MNNLDTLLKCSTISIIIGAIAVTAPTRADDLTIQDKPEKPAVTKKQEEPEEKEDEKEKPEEDEEKDEKDEKKDKKKNKKLIEDLVEDYDYLDGLFKVYRDPKTGSINMEIREDQIGKEFIYFSHITNGVVEGGHFRGQFRAQKVFTIEKRYNQIAFVEQNPYFYFDPNNNLSKAKDANISRSVMATSYIRATDEDETKYLINVDGLFKGESFDQIKPTRNPRIPAGQSFALGKLSSGKSRITDVRNYPENTAVSVDYVYSNPSPVNRGNWFDITDARNVTVGVQHTLVAMPENDYQPRFDDARVGYFIDYVNDQTDMSATPWRDMINR